MNKITNSKSNRSRNIKNGDIRYMNENIEWNINKKSQLEVFGLIVLVVIVVVGFLVFTVYKLNTPQKNIKKTYMNKELATKMLLTLSKTNVAEEDCYEHTIAQLISDCAKTYHSFSCYGKSSCELVDEVIINILKDTLDKENVRYNLTIHNTGISFVNDCNYLSDQEEGFVILPLYPGEVEVTLGICE